MNLDLIKAAVLFCLYFVVAPSVGLLVRNRPKLQRAIFFSLCFMTIGGFFEAAEWGLTIDPIFYRGTSRGFHFFWADLSAIALIVTQLSKSWRDFKFLPPGLLLFFVYCALSCVSIINAPSSLYVAFEALKVIKMSLIFVATFNFLKTESEIRFFLGSMAITMFWEFLSVLKLKYMDHVYQVYGTFEHQNALAMFAILIGMVFLAASLGPKQRGRNLSLTAFFACAAIVQSTLSRGGLVIFGIGTVAVVLCGLLECPTKRRFAVLGIVAAVGCLGLLLSIGTIMGRFNDYGNGESKKTREMLIVSAKLMVHDYPLGIGWNNFALTINHPFPYGDHIDRWQAINGNKVDKSYRKGVVESLYYLILSETGYFSFAVYLCMLMLFLWWNVRSLFFYRNTFLSAISMGIFAGCVANYAQSTLERVLTQPRNMMLWMMILAIASRIEFWRREDRKLPREDRLQNQTEIIENREDESELQPV